MTLINDKENMLVNSDHVVCYQIIKCKETEGEHHVMAYMVDNGKALMFTGPFEQCSAYMGLISRDFGSKNYHEEIEELFYKSSIREVDDEGNEVKDDICSYKKDLEKLAKLKEKESNDS